MLTVTHLLAVMLAATELDDAYLVGAAVADHGSGDSGILDGIANLDAIGIAEHQHIVQLDLACRLLLEQLNAERFALHHAVLLTAGDYNCVHGRSLDSVVFLEWCLDVLPCPAAQRADRSGIVRDSWVYGQPDT